uniref:SUEL-type lectin domain-containing protein n=1 Tax=Sinocyclocheilus rhinocerous TaxID=307959 RepID=A0A673LK59_9TELE
MLTHVSKHPVRTVFIHRCDGLRECEINTRGLEQDPCFGTYKYYTTNHICIPAGFFLFLSLFHFLFIKMSFSVQVCNCRLLPETSVTCQDGYSYLKCDNGRIQINTANYGRTDKTTCSEGRPSEQLQNTNCYSPNALAPVSKSCSLVASNGVFSDPCTNTFKYPYVSYSCIHNCKSAWINSI